MRGGERRVCGAQAAHGQTVGLRAAQTAGGGDCGMLDNNAACGWLRELRLRLWLRGQQRLVGSHCLHHASPSTHPQMDAWGQANNTAGKVRRWLPVPLWCHCGVV